MASYIPDSLSNISVSKIKASMDTHIESSKRYTTVYGASNASFENLRKHQWAHSKARKQTSTVRSNVKMSNFRDATPYGMGVQVKPKYYGDDQAQIKVRFINAPVGPVGIKIKWKAAVYAADKGSVDISNSSGGFTNIPDIDGYSARITVPSTNTGYIINLGGPKGAWKNFYDIKMYDLGASMGTDGDYAYRMDFWVLMTDRYLTRYALATYGRCMIRKLPMIAGSWVDIPQDATTNNWSDEIIWSHPGQDAVF